MEFISDAIELHDDPKQDNVWEVTFDKGIFTAKSVTDSRIRNFKIIKKPSELTEDERYTVLHYSLSKVTKEDEVHLRDIFLQAEFIEEILDEVEYDVEVRVSEYGEYDNTLTVYVSLPKHKTHEDFLMSELAKAVREGVEDDYGTHDAWDEGEVSWTVESYEKL